MKWQSLLLDEPPLQILPQLAKRIGLNEAVVLQQIHYWIFQNTQAGRNHHEGFHWTFNSYRQWQDQFPFWSLRTIRRTFASLERSGYVITASFNKVRFDRSKWYRIDYPRLEGANRCGQVDHPLGQPDPIQESTMAPPIPETIQRGPEISTTGNPMVDALMSLPYWKPDPESDALWLAEFSIEHPGFALSHITACRDFHDGKRTRHKGSWKNRLRNWMRVDAERKVQSDARKEAVHPSRRGSEGPHSQSSTEDLRRSWDQ